jgi:hypothetical protein
MAGARPPSDSLPPPPRGRDGTDSTAREPDVRLEVCATSRGDASGDAASDAAALNLDQRAAQLHALQLSGGEPVPAGGVSSLPHALLLRVFAALPVDLRLRCAEVCRGWRALVAEPSLWSRLDLSAAGGVTQPVTDALLLCAAAKAAGGLQALDVSDCLLLSHDALLAVATANTGALAELRLPCSDSLNRHLRRFIELIGLLRAAPQLRCLETSLVGDLADAQCCLLNEGELAPLRLREVYVEAWDPFGVGAAALARGVSRHASLAKFILHGMNLAPVDALDALVDAALARQLRSLQLSTCSLSPASAPSLARLLSSTALRTLHLKAMQPLDEPAAVLLAHALQRNTTLEVLWLDDVCLFDDFVAAGALMHALVAHPPSLREVALVENWPHAEQRATAGLAAAALIQANAPSLYRLSVSKCNLGDVGLAPLLQALPRNTHLKLLGCWGNGASEAFVRERLLPAVRARPGLLLTMDRDTGAWDSACDPERGDGGRPAVLALGR